MSGHFRGDFFDSHCM